MAENKKVIETNGNTIKGNDNQGNPLFSIEYTGRRGFADADIKIDPRQKSEAEILEFTRTHEKELRDNFKSIIKQNIIEGKRQVTPEMLQGYEDDLRKASAGNDSKAALNAIALRATHEVIQDLAKDEKQTLKTAARGGTSESKIVPDETAGKDVENIQGDNNRYHKIFNASAAGKETAPEAPKADKPQNEQPKDGKPEAKKSDLPPANDTTRQIQRYMDFLQDGGDKHLKDVDISRVDGIRGDKTNASIKAILGEKAASLSDEQVLKQLKDKIGKDPEMKKDLIEGMDISQGTAKGRNEIQNFMKEEKFDLVKTKDGTVSLDQTIDAFKAKLNQTPAPESQPTIQPAVLVQPKQPVQSHMA